MRYLLLPFCICFLAACGTTTNYYTPTVESWRGGNVNTLTQRWGAPDARLKSGKGEIAYLYQSAAYHNNPSTNSPFAASRGGITYSCLTTFIVNHQGRIVNVKEAGHGCYGNASFANSKSNPSAR